MYNSYYGGLSSNWWNREQYSNWQRRGDQQWRGDKWRHLHEPRYLGNGFARIIYGRDAELTCQFNYPDMRLVSVSATYIQISFNPS